MASKTLDVRLQATDNMSPAFERAGNAAKTLGSSLNEIGKGNAGLQSFSDQVRALDGEIRTVGQALTAFGAATTAAIGLSVRNFASFEAAMANVGTIANQSDAWLANMADQLRSLAGELGAPPTGLAEGLYDLIGSGIAAADSFDVLRASAVAAKAGLTDTGTAARAITSVINAYGLSADKAEHISDVLFRTVDSGVISFEELANSMGRALPLSNVLAVSIEELGAAYAQLTREGLNASEAETAFTALLTAALNPTEALTEAVREYGYESAEALIKTEGFTAFLQFLDETAGGSASRMQELTGNVRANNAALILARDGASGYVEMLVDMETAAGATSDAFERQMDTIQGSFSRFRASLTNFSIEIGEAFAPFARVGFDIATEGIMLVTDAMGAMPGPAQAAAAGLTGLAAVATTAAGGFLLLLPRIVETAAAIRALGGLVPVLASVTAATTAWTTALAVGFGSGVAIGGFMGTFVNSLRSGDSVMQAFAESTNVLASAMGRLKDGDPVGFFRTLVFGVDNATRSMESFNQATSRLLTEAARQTVLGNEAIGGAIEGMVQRNDVMMRLAEERVNDTEWMRQQIAIHVEATGQTWAMAEQTIRDSMTLTDAELAVRAEALNALAQAYLDPTTNIGELNAELNALDYAFTSGAITSDEYTDGLVRLARIYGELPNDIQSTTDAVTGLTTANELWKSGMDTAFAGLEEGEEALAALDERAKDLTLTLDDLRIAGDWEIAAELESLNELMREGADSSQEYLDAQDRINGALQDGSINYATVGAEIASLNAQLDAGTITQEEYEARIISLSQNLANYTDGSREALAATAEMTAEFANAALALGGWDNALSRLNMTGMTGEVGMFAEEWSRANLAMENSFRIIVGNTNAIIQQVDGIQSWADSLINVRDELGEIDNLLEGGFIDETIYTNAQNAYDRISVSTGNIRGNLLAVQAIQAPWIAEVVAGTERWAAELRNMPEDVQRTTLAFMDLQTVTQAQELITLGNSDAFQKMSDEGKAAFEATIQGALQVNPLLFDVLKTMGIISGTPLDFEVNYDALSEAGSAMDQLIASVDDLVATLREIYGLPPLDIPVTVNGGEGVETILNDVELVYERVQNLDGSESFFILRADVDTGELESFGEIIDSYVDPDIPNVALVLVEADTGNFVTTLDMVTGEVGEARVPVSPEKTDEWQSIGALFFEDGSVVEVPVTPVADTSFAGQYAAGWRQMMGIPDTVEVPVSPVADTSFAGQYAAGWRQMMGIPESVDVSVNVQMAGAAELAGGGLANLRSQLDIPETIDTTINVAGSDQIAQVKADIDSLDDKTVTVDVVIGTNELDTGLAQFGIGTGGGGGAAGYTAPSVTVNVEADASDAIAQLEGVAGAAAAADALSVNIPAGAPGAEDARQKLESLAGRAAAADALSVTVPVDTPGSATGIDQLQGVAGAAAAADAMSVTIPVSVSGAYSAIAQLNDVANAAANANRTVTITTYHRTVGIGVTAQHGGIPSYATGGVLFRGAEGNRPEIAHFANGGTALLPRDGLYMAPPMTYISPHNSSTSYGGDTYVVNVNVGGNVVGNDDFANEMAEQVVWKIASIKQRRDLAKGMVQ